MTLHARSNRLLSATTASLAEVPSPPFLGRSRGSLGAHSSARAVSRMSFARARDRARSPRTLAAMLARS